MNFILSKKFILILFITAAITALYFFISSNNKIDFNTQVKPIFNKKCIICHGGVKRQGGFSVLFREDALKKTKSGKYAIIPGNASGSELIRRIKETDDEERMPYKHQPLSKEEIKILEQWINEGAEWGTHWAYASVQKPILPDEDDKWIKNNIDKFIYKKLKEEKLQPSAEADKATLLRRVSLDLTGMPPPDDITQKFLKDPSDKAYENLVDALLSSPAYGEKWASMWMDLARYSDTKGYEADRPWTIWRYRDWLIKAFNNDMPYKEFLTEQLAGDLMPNTDDNKLIATAFHRNTMTNDEGGTDNDEFRTSAVIDRVNTTWSVLMGTTFNCVQCHSHPYDPFRHDEYYKFFAFFNNTRDEDMFYDYPLLRQYTGKDSTTFTQLTEWLTQNASAQDANWYTSFVKTIEPSVNSHLCDKFTNGVVYSNNYASLDNGGTCRLRNITLTGKTQIIFTYLDDKDGARLSFYADSLNGTLLNTVTLSNTKSEWKIAFVDIPEIKGKHDLYFKYTYTSTKEDLPVLFEWFAFTTKFPGAGNEGYAEAKNKFISLLSSKDAQTTPIMIEDNSEQFRTTQVFERGNWMAKGDTVTPDVPHIMNPMPANAPKNRLGLAMWLTDEKNPLTARTMTNRLWEQLFGAGLAETLEDLGTQGSPPAYKDLLDYLSWTFMHDDNWSIKKLLKEIVMSATYRQSSITNPELIQKDPNNILFARQSRVRLTGEQLRDQGLAVSHLLSKKMYGESVMPFQPDGIWSSPYNDYTWTQSKDGDEYRRAVYTYWKRSAPYPSMITFDGGSREVCIARRIRTNTPLQALTSLNDSAYLVMARQFALNIQKANSNNVNAAISAGYEMMFYKPITQTKLNALIQLYNKALTEYKKDNTAANTMMGDKNKTATPEDAAMVVVANAMMNLDEWVNKN